MTILDRLLDQVAANAAAAQPVEICSGTYWTIVVLERAGKRRAGLSSTLGGGDDAHHAGGGPPVRDAGHLLTYSAARLAALARSEHLPEASVGMATINALLDVDERDCIAINAADVIAERGAGRTIAVVGHFPFLGRVRKWTKTLWVLELNPREGDLPASMATEILPQADVVALTGTSLLNHTFDALIKLCRPDAFVIVLGATTPMSPLLFETGVDALAGTLIDDPEAALHAIGQGAVFPQIPGRRLVTLFKAPPHPTKI